MNRPTTTTNDTVRPGKRRLDQRCATTRTAGRPTIVTVLVLVALSLLRGLDASHASATAHPAKPTWGRGLTIDRVDQSPAGLSSVSCPTRRFCAAVDGSGHTMLFDGKRWSGPVLRDSDPYGFTSVSCASTDSCVAVDSAGFIDTYNGSHWRLRLLDADASDGTDQMSVSCPSVSFCAAVDTDGSEWVRIAGKWSGRQTDNALYSLSCASPTFCVAGAGGGQGVTWNGSRWSSSATIDSRSSQQIRTVSCPTSSFCVAGGADLTVWNGHKWLASEPVSPSDIESVECVSSRFCLAGDNSIGDVYRWNGTGWRHSITFHDGETVTSIACPSAVFCEAVGSAREAHVYALAPTVASSLARATTGVHYRVQLHATSGRAPYRWTKTHGSLPPGLRLSHTGIISGVAIRSGVYHFKVRVVDTLGLSSARTLHLTVRR